MQKENLILDRFLNSNDWDVSLFNSIHSPCPVGQQKNSFGSGIILTFAVSLPFCLVIYVIPDTTAKEWVKKRTIRKYLIEAWELNSKGSKATNQSLWNQRKIVEQNNPFHA